MDHDWHKAIDQGLAAIRIEFDIHKPDFLNTTWEQFKEDNPEVRHVTMCPLILMLHSRLVHKKLSSKSQGSSDACVNNVQMCL